MQSDKTIKLPRRLVWVVAILLSLTIALPLTNPPREKHEQWLKDHYLMPWDITPPGPQRHPGSLEEKLRARFPYHNYGFFSTMTDTTWEGKTVTYGYLGLISGRYPAR